MTKGIIKKVVVVPFHRGKYCLRRFMKCILACCTLFGYSAKCRWLSR